METTIDRRETPARITLHSGGFSPNGDGAWDIRGFDLSVGLAGGISRWDVTLTAADGRTTYPIRGGTTEPVPAQFVWSGLTETGQAVPEDCYFATLSMYYRKGNQPESRTAEFALDIAAPDLTLDAGPFPFSPNDDGTNDTLRISPRVRNTSTVTDWSLRILDPSGNESTAFGGSGTPTTQPIVWNGRDRKGELVQSASEYTMILKARDAYGNHSELRSTLPTDILVIKEGDHYRIQISIIYFAPFSAEFQPDKETDNIRTLQRLAEILKQPRFSSYRIAVEGHAVRSYWYDETKWLYEEAQTLMPLSQQCADLVKTQLVQMGVATDRMTTAGYGGNTPLIPHSDPDNRWKNRRVEFILRR